MASKPKKIKAITPKKLESQLASFHDDNIIPLKRTLDTIGESLQMIINNQEHQRPRLNIQIDPWVEATKAPMPAFYKVESTWEQTEADYTAAIPDLLRKYRSDRGDKDDRIYAPEENTSDQRDLYHIHTIWCGRIDAMRQQLQIHRRHQAASTTSSPELTFNTPNQKESDSFVDRMAEHMSTQSDSYPEDASTNEKDLPDSTLAILGRFLPASALLAMSQSEDPKEKQLAQMFMQSPPLINRPLYQHL
jgi:hypothetical protein